MYKKKNKIIVIVTIYIVIVSIISNSFVYGTSQDDKENNINKVSMISDISVAIISLINVVFVAGFYINDQRNSKKEKKSEYTFYWYRDFVIKDAVYIIEEHIKKCIELIENCKECKGQIDKEYILNIIEKFTYSNNDTKNRIASLLKMIDSKISSEILEAFREIQDTFTTEIANVTTDLGELEANMKSEKIELINKLYKFGLNEII